MEKFSSTRSLQRATDPAEAQLVAKTRRAKVNLLKLALSSPNEELPRIKTQGIVLLTATCLMSLKDKRL